MPNTQADFKITVDKLALLMIRHQPPPKHKIKGTEYDKCTYLWYKTKIRYYRLSEKSRRENILCEKVGRIIFSKKIFNRKFRY